MSFLHIIMTFLEGGYQPGEVAESDEGLRFTFTEEGFNVVFDPPTWLPFLCKSGSIPTMEEQKQIERDRIDYLEKVQWPELHPKSLYLLAWYQAPAELEHWLN